jgi:hypothetical protein
LEPVEYAFEPAEEFDGCEIDSFRCRNAEVEARVRIVSGVVNLAETMKSW